MGQNKSRYSGVPASEFNERHKAEFEESEDAQSTKLLSAIFPQGKLSLASLCTPSPERDAWLSAREALPSRQLIRSMRNYWLVSLMKSATQENSTEAYRDLLEELLIRLGIEAPEGVLVPRRRRVGAPSKRSTSEIYQTWILNDRPGWGELAFRIYGSEYTRSDASQRKRLRDLCRRAVQRSEGRADSLPAL